MPDVRRRRKIQSVSLMDAVWLRTDSIKGSLPGDMAPSACPEVNDANDSLRSTIWKLFNFLFGFFIFVIYLLESLMDSYEMTPLLIQRHAVFLSWRAGSHERSP